MKRLFLLLSLLFLACREGKVDGSVNLKKFQNRWYTISIKGNRIGYTVKRIEKKDGLITIYERSLMDLNLLGKPETLFTENLSHFDTSFNLKGFDFNLKAGRYETHIEGKVEKKGKLGVKVESGGMEKSFYLDFSNKLTSLSAIPFLISGLRKNSEVKFSIFDPMFSAILPVSVSVKDIKGDTIIADVYIQNLHYLLKTLKDGTLLYQFEPPFVKTELSTEKEALKNITVEERLDVYRMFAIPSDRVIEDARRVSHLIVEIEGLGDEPLKLEDDFQRVVKRNPMTLEISSQIPENDRIVDGGAYLKATEFIQSDAPEIRKKAEEICEGVESPIEKTRRIMMWVYENIEKNPAASIPSALAVLKEREGDCNEHSVLFTALARAAGIPAKIVVGVVYLGGSFFYHAWNAVMIDGRWYPVDPTFGQFPADATHIKMEEGELKNQAKVLSVVGRIRIKIKKVEYR